MTVTAKPYRRKYICIIRTTLMILFVAAFLVLFFTWNPISSGDIVQTSLTVDNVAQYFTSQEKCKIMANCKRFEFFQLDDESKEIVKYQVKKSVSENNFDVMSYEDVIIHLKTDIEFRNTFFDILQLGLEKESDPDKLGPKQAYFFEVCPITRRTYSTLPFEFVLVPAPSLDGIKADPT